jgi:hypothetical protein
MGSRSRHSRLRSRPRSPRPRCFPTARTSSGTVRRRRWRRSRGFPYLRDPGRGVVSLRVRPAGIALTVGPTVVCYEGKVVVDCSGGQVRDVEPPCCLNLQPVATELGLQLTSTRGDELATSCCPTGVSFVAAGGSVPVASYTIGCANCFRSALVRGCWAVLAKGGRARARARQVCAATPSRGRRSAAVPSRAVRDEESQLFASCL